MSMTAYVDDQATSEIELEVEELEEMIAPSVDGRLAANHNETLVSD